MTKTLLASSLFCLSIFALSTARAVVVTNTTTGSVVFDSAGFENDTVGTAPSATGTGSWSAYHIDAVTNSPTPGPAFGTKYVTTTRDAISAGGPGANLSANQTTNGDQLHVEWHAWYPANADDNILIDSGTRMLGRITGGQYLNYNGSAYVSTGVSYSAQQWQKWELDYTIGSSTYNLSVNDSSPVTIAALAPGGFARMDFGHNGLDTFFLDGAPIPEPASLALVLVAGQLLVRRRR
jgi:hypothetical protein